MAAGAHERPERCGSKDSARAEASPGAGMRYAANACSTMTLLRGLSWPATASSLPASSCTNSVVDSVLALMGKQLSACSIPQRRTMLHWLCGNVWHLLGIRLCSFAHGRLGPVHCNLLQGIVSRQLGGGASPASGPWAHFSGCRMHAPGWRALARVSHRTLTEPSPQRSSPERHVAHTAPGCTALLPMCTDPAACRRGASTQITPWHAGFIFVGSSHLGQVTMR